MRIKKTFQTTVPTGKVLNSYTESNVDTYSCNYVNQIGKTAKINLNSSGQNFPQNTDVTVDFDTIEYNQISNLTLDDNKIVIGAGIHTILLSARYSCPSGTYGKYIYIRKDGNPYEQLAFKMTKQDNTLETSMVIPVQEGDKYYIAAYQENTSALTISSSASQTFMTVTVLN